MPNGQEQPTAEAEFVQEAEKELTELMRELGETDRRHGARPRRLEQDVDLLVAKIDALELERLALLEEIEAVLDGGEELAARGAPAPEGPRRKLSEMADEVLDVAEHLILVGEKLNDAAGIETKAAWMAGAKGKLNELIRGIEGGALR